ncbi:MAG: hypothetical protein EAZ30_04215 [Betaproteobacteria bacterium]|nr:MAG: hypothetical protein EAZ30_04215 [Betaproteobacteria bacterium]
MKSLLFKRIAHCIGALTLSAVAATATATATATAQNFPSKPLSMIVAFPAGGGSDVIGRLVAKGMQDALGQTIIVENVVGVGG